YTVPRILPPRNRLKAICRKRGFGEGHVPIHLFVSHISSKKKFDEGNMAEIELFVKKYRIFIIIFRKFLFAFFTVSSMPALLQVSVSIA
ncbi:MAG: hypothetical protein Q7I93_04085, partial [Syntrophales bacterium]|nr:hypothetical protein [Syntrophales bacterium]